MPPSAVSLRRDRPSKQTIQLKNHILLQLTQGDRDTLLAEAECVRLPAGSTLARPGDEIASIYFPDAGVISVVSEMATGHQVAVAVVGREGLLGVGAVLSVQSYVQRLVALVESHGVRVCADRFRYVFGRSDLLRRATLDALGRRFVELTMVAACNRVHSHRQRLARWLLLITDKAGQRSLRVTHDTLAQMVGGPRHAVTVALNEALYFYRQVVYPRHLNSFPLYGVQAHGFWTATADVQPRLYVLVSYDAGEEPCEVGRRSMQSPEFADDTRDFNVADIVGVDSTILIPSTNSPLT